MSPLQLTEQELQLVCSILKQTHFNFDQAWVFGSRTSNKMCKPFSDLDIALLGKSKFALRDLAILRESFINSDLAFKVDVVDFFSLPQSLQNDINENHIVILSLADKSPQI